MAREPGEVGDRELNKATVRILQVLSSFASDAPGFGVTDLSQLLGMTKNMIYRALTTLVEERYLMRDEGGSRYQLGYRILELQDHALDGDFRTFCNPYLRRMQSITGESVSLAVHALDYCVLIDGIETRKPGVWRVRIGNLLPLFGPASGRVMLAYSSDAEIADYIRRHKPLKNPQTGEAVSIRELQREIETIRDKGYSRVIRNTNPQMVSVAFPIHDLDGSLHGAVSVGGPRERFEAQLDRQLPELIDLIDELNSRSRLFSANAAGSELS